MYPVDRALVWGVLVLILLLVLVAGVSGDESCTFVGIWPYEGGSGATPPDISIDPSGIVYLTGPENGRVLQYSPEGTLTTWWELNDTESGTSVVPAGIVADGSRGIFVIDRKNNTIIRLTWNKKELWGREGSGNGEYDRPGGIAVDSSGTLYVADTGNNRVQKIHSGGNYLLQWGSYGTARGAFSGPGSIAIDAQNHVYVTDAGNSRIQKFSSVGTALSEWGSWGTGTGQFRTPSGIAVDKWGNIYVADHTARVQKFSPTGEYFTTCNTTGIAYDVAVNPSGELFVIMQSGSSWEIGVYRFSTTLTKETPVKHHNFTVTVPQTPPGTGIPDTRVTVQNVSFPEQNLPSEINLTMTEGVPLVSSDVPALVFSAENTTVIRAPGYPVEEEHLFASGWADFFYHINAFLNSVFGMQIRYSA